MIRIFFNEDGYYIAGENIEITRRCSPATTLRGDNIFQPLHHAYKILYTALTELEQVDIKDDIIVYNDSRIIDEVNGFIEPLDDSCRDWLNVIRRSVIPTIKPSVFFRKKPSSFISEQIVQAHTKMIKPIDEKTRQKIINNNLANTETRNKRLLSRLRQQWFGDKNADRS